MSLEVININKSYGEVKALKNISFKLKKGEIVGFLGPNDTQSYKQVENSTK